MNEEADVHANDAEREVSGSPLEQLTTLVLDAADAANSSAQSTQESISKLSRVVEVNEQTTRAVRNAPAILGAVVLSIGVVLAVLVAIVFSKINEKAGRLDASIALQTEALGKNEALLKELKALESNLSRFQDVAEETTQRAVVILREQVKTDRLAMQQLEVRRLDEMLASLRGGMAAAARPTANQAPDVATRMAALEKSIAGIDQRLRQARPDALEEGFKRLDGRLAQIEKAASSAASGRSAAPAESQATDLKAALEALAVIRAEMGAIRGLLEKRGSDASPAGPVYRKSGEG